MMSYRCTDMVEEEARAEVEYDEGWESDDKYIELSPAPGLPLPRSSILTRPGMLDMEQEQHFQSPTSVHTATYPIMEVKWTPETRTGDVCHVFEDLDKALHQMQQTLKNAGSFLLQTQTADLTTPLFTAIPQVIADSEQPLSSLNNTPRMRPPPPTPPEQAHISHSLSTPTLPNFHTISEPALVSSYQTQRSTNPVAFDAMTREIKSKLVLAKIERGGSGYLEEGDYTVELASREDAEKAERYVRRRGLSDLPPLSLTENIMGKKDDGKGKWVHEKDADERKYSVSGAMRYQKSRKTTEDVEGKQVIAKTWIEITQTIDVPKHAERVLDEATTTIENMPLRPRQPTSADVAKAVDEDKPAVEVARMQHKAQSP